MIRVGQRLQEERKKQGFTIEQVAKATKIRSSFLEALEKGDYKVLPSSAYVQGFIKNYAEFLGLPIRDTLALFRREFDEREFLGVLPSSFTKQEGVRLPGFRLRLTSIAFLLGVFFILGFIFYEYRSAFFNPPLSVTSPAENAKITTQVVTVIGKTDPNNIVTINDLPVFVDSDGGFKKDLTVFDGNTTITAKVVNSFGRKSILVRHIIVVTSP